MRKKVILSISAAIIVILLVVVAVMGMMMRGGQPTSLIGKDDKTANLFYDSLGNAAGQQQLRVAMYRATYATTEDADAKQNTGTETSSVAEVDIATTKSRSVYATNASSSEKPAQFTIGRCMDGTTYSDDYAINKTPRPTSLAEAADVLKTNQHLYKTNVPIFIPCPNLGIITGASIDLAAFRFSDGVFPVTITEPQANNWKNQVKEADLFTIKDEGTVEYNGQQLKKIGFTPKDQKSVNKKLYSIFNETAEIDKIKAQQPNAIYEYEFISIAPANTGSVGGYYLIDEKSKLPVYSELYGTNTTKSTSRFNIARTKQAYQFGKPLSLTIESPLEILP
jgi:hypothetical protein